MYDVPEALRSGPVARTALLAAGVSARVLEGPQFRRIHWGVYRHRDHDMSWADQVEAARMALPAHARTTGVTRLQELGIDVGSRHPLRFVVQGDLHLTLDGVFLHRTVAMPPHDADGVSPAAAFVAYCAEARAIDAIKVGSVLVNTGLVVEKELASLLAEQHWRRGALETTWALPHVDRRCRSMPEAELVTLVRFAGLPDPEVNACVKLLEDTEVTPDLWYAAYRLGVEYDGGHHQQDRAQYVADIDRYAAYRRSNTGYVQVTRERMRTPKALMRSLHAELVARGYLGPEPVCDAMWDALFLPLHQLVRRDGQQQPGR